MVRISFTGHRPKDLFGTYDMENERARLLAIELLKIIESLIVERGATEFISGGALGTDQLAFMCVHKLKQKYPHIKNILAIPYADQPLAWVEQLEKAKKNGWKKAISDLEKTLKRYENILKVADELVFVDTLPKYRPKNMPDDQVGKHSNAKLQIRNIYMVDHSEIVVAVFNGDRNRKSGTANCVDEAIKKNKELIILNPNRDFQIEK